MKIFVKVKPKSKKESLIKIDDNHFVVQVKEIPEEGRANKAVLKIFSDHFNIPLDCVNIVSGLKNKSKILEIKL